MKTKKIHHQCKFMRTCDILNELYPPHMKFGKIRRKFRESLLVSEENGRRSYTPMGNSGYVFQKERQLTRYFHVIHPYSKFCQYWEMFAIFEFCFSFVIRSLLITLYPYMFLNQNYQILSFFSDVFEAVDVWLQFNVGYKDKENQEIVLESRKIVFHITTKFHFYLDALTSLPIDMVVYIYAKTFGPPETTLWNILRYNILFKISKLYSMTRYLRHMAKIFNWGDFTVRAVWAILFNIVFCHCMTCALHVILRAKPNDKITVRTSGFTPYIRGLYKVTSIFFGQEGIKSEIEIHDMNNEIWFFLLIIILNFAGLLFNGVFIQTALWRISAVAFSEMRQEIQKFLAQENLPALLHKKVMMYLNFRYCNGYFNEEVILNTLSPPLRREVLQFLCSSFINKSDSIFTDLPEEVKVDLCFLLKFEIFLPGDVIFRVGKRSKRIYFLNSGTVAVYSPFGKEITHWYDGQQFGMSSFLETPIHRITTIALEMTECYTLLYSDFIKQVSIYPKLLSKIKAELHGPEFEKEFIF